MKEKNIMKTWKYALTAALLPASLWAATITGTIGAPAPGTPVSGVKVVLIENTSAGAHLDSTTSAGNGSYTFSNVTVGQRVVQASKSGYNSAIAVVAISTAGQAATANISISVNNKTSTVQGYVKKATDSSVAKGASVTLSGGVDNPRTVLTDSTGFYKFDSVTTGTGLNVSAALAGFQNSSTGNVSVAWNSTTTVQTMFLTRNLGSISGTISRNDTNTIKIVGAKLVFSQGATKVDSTTTDANGNYTLTLNAGTYNVSVSAAGYKSNHDFKSKDTTATVVFGSNTVMNTGLTPALSTIGGTIRTGNATTGAPVSGAKVVLQHRMSNNGTGNVWETVDSTTTDANGIYAFTSQIAAAALASGSYRIVVTAPGHRNYPSTNAEITADVYQVAYGATLTITNMFLTGVVMHSLDGKNHNIRFSSMGGNLMLDLGTSKVVRTVQIFSLEGSLQHQVSVPAGESSAIVPATFADGYLFQVK